MGPLGARGGPGTRVLTIDRHRSDASKLSARRHEGVRDRGQPSGHARGRARVLVEQDHIGRARCERAIQPLVEGAREPEIVIIGDDLDVERVQQRGLGRCNGIDYDDRRESLVAPCCDRRDRCIVGVEEDDHRSRSRRRNRGWVHGVLITC